MYVEKYFSEKAKQNVSEPQLTRDLHFCCDNFGSINQYKWQKPSLYSAFYISSTCYQNYRGCLQDSKIQNYSLYQAWV